MCVPPPTPDPTCPKVSVLNMNLTSCCASNGMCGLDASILGMGCIDLAAAMAATMGLIPIPAPVKCGGVVDAGEDGGTKTGEDAGK
jgi:hypothetical protein